MIQYVLILAMFLSCAASGVSAPLPPGASGKQTIDETTNYIANTLEEFQNPYMKMGTDFHFAGGGRILKFHTVKNKGVGDDYFEIKWLNTKITFDVNYVIVGSDSWAIWFKCPESSNAIVYRNENGLPYPGVPMDTFFFNLNCSKEQLEKLKHAFQHLGALVQKEKTLFK